MPQRGRFAFLVHPRNDFAADAAMIHPALGLVPNVVYDTAARVLPIRPWVHATIRATDRPEQPFGDVICVPLPPKQLLGGDPARVARRIGAAIDLAVARGADVVGLGALTAPATAGGAALVHRTDVGVTNGNAFTAAITARSVQRVVEGMGAAPVVALVGATGSVGTAVAEALDRAGTASELVLFGRTRGHLDALAARLGGRVSVSTSMDDCRRADVVVLMTSAAGALLGPEHLRHGAVVVDDTQPRNTSPALAALRPDVLVVDGGLVATPGLTRRGAGIGVARDAAFACLAETALLALDGHRGHFSIGRPTLDQVDRTEALAERFGHLGFDLAPPTSFGRPVEVAGWNAPASDVVRDEVRA